MPSNKNNSPKEIVERLESNDPSLKKLLLLYPPTDYCDDNDSLDRFLDALRGNNTVEYVLLELPFVRGIRSAEEYESVLSALGEGLSELKEMEILRCKIPLAPLFRGLRSARKLIRLNMGFVKLIDNNNAADAADANSSLDCSALRDHPSLEQFCLSDFQFLEQQVQGDGNNNSNSNGTVEDTRLDSLWHALSTCPNLEKVQLFTYRRNDDSDNDGNGGDRVPWSPAALAKLAASSRSIQHLMLRRIGLKHQHVQEFATALQTRLNDPSSALRVMDLNENDLGDAGCFALMEAVANSARNNRNLREVNLRSNGLTSFGCRSIAALLTRTNVNPGAGGLEKLNLACNKIGDEGAVALADLVLSTQQTTNQEFASSSLKHLELNRTGLTDKGCVPLANALVRNNVLLSLGLSNNEMTDQTYVAFASALKSNTTLRSVNLQALQRASVGQAGYDALVDMLRDNYDLEAVATAPYSYHTKFMRAYLRLNHAGRKRLLQDQTATPQEWLEAIVSVQDEFNAIAYLVRANPGICQN